MKFDPENNERLIFAKRHAQTGLTKIILALTFLAAIAGLLGAILAR